MPLFPDDPYFDPAYVKKCLRGIHVRLEKCAGQAMSAHNVMCAASGLAGGALGYCGTRAHLINSLMVEAVRQEFGEDVVDVNGFAELQVHPHDEDVRLDLRFKKQNDDGETMNIHTGAQNSYRYQNCLPWKGAGDAARVIRLTVSWRFNATATEYEALCVVYMKGYQQEWAYDIRNAADDEGTAPMPVPMPQGGLPGAGGMRFQSKDKKAKANKTERGAG
jgi:hypothetical protein